MTDKTIEELISKIAKNKEEKYRSLILFTPLTYYNKIVKLAKVLDVEENEILNVLLIHGVNECENGRLDITGLLGVDSE